MIKAGFIDACRRYGLTAYNGDLLQSVQKSEWIFAVTHELTSTGAPLALATLVKVLKEAGKIPIVFSRSDGPLRQTLVKDGFVVIIFPRLEFDKFIDHWSSIVSLTIVNTAALGALVRRLNNNGHPVFWWIHESRGVYHPSWQVQLPIALADNIHIFGVSEIAVNNLVRIRPNYKPRILHLGVPDYRLLEADDELDESLLAGRKIFAIIGSITSLKNQACVCRAISRLAPEVREKCFFVFAGKSEEQDCVRELFECERRFPNAVRYVGEVSHRRALALCRSAVSVIVASKSESVSLSAIEAMSLSKIVILPEKLEISGLLTRAGGGLPFDGSAADLAEKIALVVANESGFQGMKESARRCYEENFTETRFRDSVLALMRELAFVPTAYENYASQAAKQVSQPEDDYVFISKTGDTLHPDAYREVRKVIRETRPDFIYSDHESVSGANGERLVPHFKPDYAPDRLRGSNYIGRFMVVRKDLLPRTDLAFESLEDSEYYRLALELTQKAKHIVHIPKILYTARKEVVDERKEIAVLEQHLERIGLKGRASPINGLVGKYHIKYAIEGVPLVSIIICNKNHYEDLQRCIKSVETKSTYKNFEIIIVDNGSDEPETIAYYEELERRPRFQILRIRTSFNFSRMCNCAVRESKGEYVLLLNNDIEVISPEWIGEMLMYCQRNDVGAVGARLLYPDGCIQHVGVVMGLCGSSCFQHLHLGAQADYRGEDDEILTAQNYSVVTGACLMVKRTTYDLVGGLEEDFAVGYNDVDFCLKLRERGLLVVYTPFAALYHLESKTRGHDYEDARKIARAEAELRLTQLRHQWFFKNPDPYFNPNRVGSVLCR